MVTAELLEYIRSEREHGESRQAITDVLLREGWALEDINAACEQISPSSKPAPTHVEPVVQKVTPSVVVSTVAPAVVTPLIVESHPPLSVKIPVTADTSTVSPVTASTLPLQTILEPVTPVTPVQSVTQIKPKAPAHEAPDVTMRAEPTRIVYQPQQPAPTIASGGQTGLRTINVMPITAQRAVNPVASPISAPTTAVPLAVPEKSAPAHLPIIFPPVGAQASAQPPVISPLNNTTSKVVAPVVSPLSVPLVVAEEKRRPRNKIWIGVLLLLIIAIGGAFGFGMSTGQIALFDTPPYAEGAVLAGLSKGFGGITSSSYESRIRIASEAREGGISPLKLSAVNDSTSPFIIGMYQLSEASASLPPDVDLVAKLSGSGDGTSDAGSMRLRLDSSLRFGDTTGEVAGEVMKIGADLYSLIDKYPISDVGPIRGKWIKIAPEDLVPRKEGNPLVDPALIKKEFDIQRSVIGDELSVFLASADKTKALRVVGKPVRENRNGQQLYKYHLEFNPETIPAWYQEVATEIGKRFGDKSPISFSQKTLQYLGTSEWKYALDYFNKNGALTFWVDGAGTPKSIEYSYRLIPPDRALGLIGKQYRLTASLELSNINVPVKLTAPADAISYNDAVILTSGMSKDEYLFSMQEKNVISVRAALLQYKNVTGFYPNTLEELLSDQTQVASAQPVTPGRAAAALPGPFLAKLPLDAYTNAPYEYAPVITKGARSNYAFRYMMSIPKNSPPLYSAYFGIATTNGVFQKKFNLYYAGGVNNADAQTLSREAVALSKNDADKDGVPDALEEYLGTDKTKSDTDGDLHSDFQELSTGTNPLVAETTSESR